MIGKALAEFLGTALIVATVLGAGFAQAALGADPALGLLMIAIAVGGVLFVSISIFAPLSGAHFNPIVSMALLVLKKLSPLQTSVYVLAQLLGAFSGAMIANLMFGSNVAISQVSRFSSGSFVGEVVASAGLVLIVLLLIHFSKQDLIAASVALWILAGHLFTSSTAFANPAVTVGRIFSTAPSSISVDSSLWFILAQAIGLVVALFLFSQLARKQDQA
jgi:glycerol uptake facilitator-like aquaporin